MRLILTNVTLPNREKKGKKIQKPTTLQGDAKTENEKFLKLYTSDVPKSTAGGIREKQFLFMLFVLGTRPSSGLYWVVIRTNLADRYFTEYLR